MTMTKLADDFAVSPQITVGDIPVIKAAGFQTIICNRPDGESADQTNFEDIETAAKEAGLAIHYIPVAGIMRREDVVDFSVALQQATGPVLAYCRSGARSTGLWELSQQ